MWWPGYASCVASSHDEERRQRDVCVDRDPAAKAALVVVERRPGLVGDVVDLNGLARRKPDQLLRPGLEIVEQVLEDGDQLVAAQDVTLTPGLIALGEGALAREHLVELAMRRLEHILGDPLGTNAVAALDLVLVGDLLAREPARDRLEPDEL